VRRTLQPLVVLLGALAVLAVIAIASAASSGSDQNNPSSRSAGRLGTLALYTWLQRLGLPVHRVSGSFDLGATDVLIEYAPSVAFSQVEMDALAALLRGGGDVILVTGAQSIAVTQPLLAQLNVQVGAPLPEGTAVPAQPFDGTNRVHRVPVGPGYSLAPVPPLVPLLTSNSDVVAAAVQVRSAGRAYVIGDTEPFSNDGLRHGDSAYFVLSLLQRSRGGNIGFDEFHHGEGTSSNGVAAIFDGPIGVASVLLAVIVLASLALNGRRVGRPIPASDPNVVPSAGSYLRAMGQLFSRSRQRGAVAARYADELKRRVGELTGIDAHLMDGDFVAAVAASGDDRAWSLEQLLSKLRTMGASQPDASSLLTAAREVDSFERAWADRAQLRP